MEKWACPREWECEGLFAIAPSPTVSERSVVAVALATVASRLTGLLRDMLLFALLGLGPWSGAFLFAFTVPNFFRRLLGEGALTSAMVPLFSETRGQDPARTAFPFLNCLLTRLVGVLLLFLFGAFIVEAAAFPWQSEHWRRALGLTLLMSPYLLFACLSAMLCGALNVLGSFGLPALTALILNLAMGGACTLALLLPMGTPAALFIICCAVLLGGVLQVAFPCYLLRREGWRFHWDCSSNPLLLRLWGLFLPAVFGAAMAQINATVSRILAYWLTRNGISTLYLSSRLTELPIGIFAIAVVTVVFPALSRYASSGDAESFSACYRSSQRAIAMVTFPATLGLIFLGQPILCALFQWGNYSASDLQQTLPVLRMSALGIPLYAFVGGAVRAFHARQNMVVPLRIALLSIGVNLFLTVAWTPAFGAVGIAGAGVAAALLQCLLLHFALRGSLIRCVRFRPALSLLLANGLAALLMFCVLRFLVLPIPPRPLAILQIALALPLVFSAYVFLLRLLRYGEVSLFFEFFKIFSHHGRP
jgi:putative peptidoglycan lipid II flippase